MDCSENTSGSISCPPVADLHSELLTAAEATLAGNSDKLVQLSPALSITRPGMPSSIEAVQQANAGQVASGARDSDMTPTPGRKDQANLAPADTIAQLCQLPFVTQALYVAAKLGIADLLVGGPRPSDQLADATGADAPSLYRILRALCGVGLFEEIQPRVFQLTAVGACLRSDVPDSQLAYAIMYGDPVVYQVAAQLLPCVMTGETAWKHALGMELFEYFGTHPELAAVFNAGMSDGMRQRQRAIQSYDLSTTKTLVDVGGNQGRLLTSLLQANPHLRGVLFDLPQVVVRAGDFLESVGVAGRCEVVGGDFFREVPPGGDVYLVSTVIHDWADDPAVRILQNCRRAMTATGKLLLIERILPPTIVEITLPLLSDLTMLAIGGRERTEAEYRTLLAAADLDLRSVNPSDSPYCLLVATPR